MVFQKYSRLLMNISDSELIQGGLMNNVEFLCKFHKGINFEKKTFFYSIMFVFSDYKYLMKNF